MCRSKADGGRLCPCQSSARRSAKYKAKKAAVALGDAPTIGARNVSDAPAGVFPEGMPARESFEKLRAGWDADAAKNVIATVNSLTDEELEGAAGDALVAAYPDMMSAMLSAESMRGLDGVTRRDAVRAAVAVEVGCALAAEADRDAALSDAREQLADAVAELKDRRDTAREGGEWDKLSELSSELAATEGQLDSVYERWFSSWRKVVDADSAVVKARQEAHTRLLAQVRDMGGGFDAKAVFAPRSSRDGKKVVQDVSRLYPTDWNQSFSSPSHNRVKVVLVNDAMGASLTEYGVYRHVAARGKDGASVGELRVVNRGEKWLNEETACHEMMHRMERTVPGLVGAEQAFLRYRARDTNYDTLYQSYVGRDAPEGYADSFPRVYAGRIYDTPYPYAFEVMSVGVEHVFYGNNGDLSGEDDREGASPSADREYRGFVLSALASL